MPFDSKNRKKTLNDSAYIYEKRNSQTEKEKLAEMNSSQKRSYLAEYYLKPVLIVLVIVAILGYLFFESFINKKETVFYVVNLNDTVTGDTYKGVISDPFMNYCGFNTKKQQISFNCLYSNAEKALKAGTSTTSDMQRISAYLFAQTMDVMCADKEGFIQYAKNGCFYDLTTILSDDELKYLQPYFYYPDLPENNPKHPYGLILYNNAYIKQLNGSEKEPILGVISNTKNKETAIKYIHFLFPELDSIKK